MFSEETQFQLSLNFFSLGWPTLMMRFTALRKSKIGFLKSAYEMKNNLCSFERPFKKKKNSVFLFEISFFVLEILAFYYYAN